ncbi:MAG: hypothetical protein RL112_132, partial [Planctomycetota bacterium]
MARIQAPACFRVSSSPSSFEPHDPRDPASRAESVYAAHQARLGRGEAADLEALCAAHPALADELRQLARREREYGALLGGPSAASGAAGGGRFFRRDERAPDPRAGGLARSFAPGERIGDFELVRYIGHGGMGQVWEATQLSLRRRVALKFVLPKHTDEST